MLQCEVTPSTQQRRMQSEEIPEIHRCHLYDHHDHLGSDRVFSHPRIVYRDRTFELVPLAILRDFHWRVRRLFMIAEIIAHFVFKALDKKYTPLIERKFKKHFSDLSKED